MFQIILDFIIFHFFKIIFYSIILANRTVKKKEFSFNGIVLSAREGF